MAEPRPLTAVETLRWTRIGLLSALAMALGYLETFIPIPIPGVKLGLANIAVLIALAQKDVGGAFCIGIIKVLAAGLLFGNPLTMAFSAAGTLLAFAAMAPLSRLRTMHLAMVSVAGAIAHEAGQLAVAAIVLGTPLVWYSAPILLAAGGITGLACGIIASRTVSLLEDGESGRPHATPGPACEPPGEPSLPPRHARQRSRGVNAKAAIIIFILYAVAMLRASSWMPLAAGLAIALAACIAGRIPPRVAGAALRPFTLILVITFIAQVASFQAGPALLQLGPIALTAEALRQTIVMCTRLAGITAASIALMQLTTVDSLVAAIPWMLAPLRRLGLRTEGFAMALQVALQAVPVLAQTAQGQFESWKSEAATAAFWREVIPAFIATSYRQACGNAHEASSHGKQPQPGA